MDFPKRTPPMSCDTFAVLPPGTLDGCVVFGKNSDRPNKEVQEVIYVPAADHPSSSKVQCTYIEVEQVPHTFAVVLSKPAWMWGAEMGANEFDVCIGNEAVWTHLNDDDIDGEKKLLGMDLLRLALERGKSALEALNVITSLIDKYGMGGNCSDTIPNFTYHNSFLIADPSEVWILECAGVIWAAEKVKQSVRNISNELSIRTDIDLSCDNLERFAEEKKFWNPKNGPLDFKRAFDMDVGEGSRYSCGKRLLTTLSEGGTFCETEMFTVLRDKPSGICMSSGSFVSTGSQVSVLQKSGSGKPSVHYFTATPDPGRSVFKPFIFTEDVKFSNCVISPVPSGTQKPDRRHSLIKLQQSCQKLKSAHVRKLQVDLENEYVSLARDIVQDFPQKKKKASDIFSKVADAESSLYIDADK